MKPSWTVRYSDRNCNTWSNGRVTDIKSTHGSTKQTWMSQRPLQSSTITIQESLGVYRPSLQNMPYSTHLTKTLGLEGRVMSGKPHFPTPVNSSQLQSLLRQVHKSGHPRVNSSISDLHFFTFMDNVHSLSDCAYYRQCR